MQAYPAARGRNRWEGSRQNTHAIRWRVPAAPWLDERHDLAGKHLISCRPGNRELEMGDPYFPEFVQCRAMPQTWPASSEALLSASDGPLQRNGVIRDGSSG